MKYLIGIILTIFCYSNSFCQSLAFYGDVMINADKPEHRQYAAEIFKKEMSSTLSQESSFQNRFINIPWISIQHAADSSFRVLSWQLDLGEGQYEYYSFLQTPNKLFQSAGRHGKTTYNSNAEISFEDINGGLIYKILQAPDDTKVHYLLSFMQIDAFTKVKILEPLQFEKDVPILGKPTYFSNSTDRNALHGRLVLRYSADANASFVLDEESNRIVYDNLVMVQGRMEGQGPTLVPDGSYKAYQLTEHGSWTYVDKLYNQWNEGPLDPDAVKKRDQRLFKKKN